MFSTSIASQQSLVVISSLPAAKSFFGRCESEKECFFAAGRTEQLNTLVVLIALFQVNLWSLAKTDTVFNQNSIALTELTYWWSHVMNRHGNNGRYDVKGVIIMPELWIDDSAAVFEVEVQSRGLLPFVCLSDAIA